MESPRSKYMRILAATILIITGVAVQAGTGVANAATANANAWPCTQPYCVRGDILGYVEANPSLNLRSAPCATSACAIAGHLPFGAQVAIRCYTLGDWVNGWGGYTNEWDLIINPHADGYLGWASDAWINTGGDTAKMVEKCP
jgi:hypothetical protein